MGCVVSHSIANRYSKTIWVKCDVKKKNGQMEKYTVEGQEGFAGIELGTGISYDWNKIETKFTPVNSGDFKELSVKLKDKKVMYVTVIAEDGEIICDSLPIDYKRVVVTKDAQLRKAQKKQPMKLHKKYEMVDMGFSRESIRKMEESKESNSKSYEQTKKNYSEAETKLTSKTSECNSLKQKLEMAEKQLSVQSEKRKQSQQDTKLLRIELADKVKQISSLTVEREHMVDREHDLEASKGKLKIELESKVDVTEHENVLKELHELQEKNKDLQQKIDVLMSSESYEQVKKNNSEAETKLKSKTSECNSLKRKLEMAEKQLSVQRKKSKQSRQDIRLLRIELADKVKQISSLTVEREHMVDREHDLEDSKGKLKIELELKVDVTEHEHVLKELHELQEKNKDLQQKVDVYMNSADERTIEKPRRCITNLSTEKLEAITIKSKGDKEDCNIIGMALTNTGTILLADWNNNNIKSVSSDNKVLSVLSLPSEPSAITVLDTTTAVVAAENNKLYIVNISDNNTLSLRGETKLEYGIFAMVSYNGNIVATCYTKPWTIQMITIKGEVLWSVAVDHSGQELFTLPEDITITTIKGSAVVVVSDYWKNTLTVLEAETGRYIRTIDPREGKWPERITVDNDGNVYICYSYTEEIGVWSNDFKESKILLPKLGEPPSCIVYSAVDDSLYVSYDILSDSRNTVDRFRLV